MKIHPNDKWAYSNYKDNIYIICRGLRRKLGYLEPNHFSLYTYLEPKDKSIIRLSLELPIIYLIFLILLFTSNEIARIAISIVFILGLCLIGIEIIIIVCSLIKKKLEKIHIMKNEK